MLAGTSMWIPTPWVAAAGATLSQAAVTMSRRRQGSSDSDLPRETSKRSLQHFLDAAGGVIDIGGEAADLVRREIAIDEHFGAAVDGGERVAEVVNDGGGQTADGGEALPADQLFARVADGVPHGVEGGGEAADLVAPGDIDVGNRSCRERSGRRRGRELDRFEMRRVSR